MASYDRKSYSGVAALTTLDGSINDSIETFTLADETGWPDGSAGDFYAQIEDEVLLCDTRTATSVTVKTGGRGACGTSAAAHTSGVEVAHVFTSADADEANYTTSETVGKVTAAGQILIGDGANSLAALDVKTSGRILVGNGTTGVSVAVSGDATLAASGALTIADDAISYGKVQNISATDRLLGRDTAAAGNIEELTVGGGVEFTGSGGIQRSALTGDVTATAGSNATSIADNVVDENMLTESVAGDGLLGGDGTALSINADNSTLGMVADVLQVLEIPTEVFATDAAPPIPHSAALRRVPANTNTYTNVGAYAVLPNATDRTASQLSFTKLRADTKLILTLSLTAYQSSGVAQSVHVGLTPDGGTTDWEVGKIFLNNNDVHTSISGTNQVTGLAAGAYTIEPQLYSGPASVIVINADDIISFSVTETY